MTDDNVVRLKAVTDPDLLIPFRIDASSDGKPIEFAVPNLNFLDPKIADKIRAWVLERQRLEKSAKAGDTAAVEQVEKFRADDEVLFMLKLVVPAAVFKQVDALPIGYHLLIQKQWQARSELSMGEYGASSTS